ncbi:unnamed protein product [Triticum turgidum subsp. durum]|uniref:Uncharacterized protein n=1 Tax=Triticum turgidum subsp. durum TaxID=4567 RepID=A0A9R0STG6_TRITD|nr:unnamed protein product [Triticum turgidum subsp. durum]
MKVKIESSKIVKPSYEDGEAPAHAQRVPLSVFDKVTYGEHVALIFAFRPPNPPNSEVELGLAKALAVYREWAGRIRDGRRSVLLNDAGARFVEATVDAPMAVSMPSGPSPEVRLLHPRIDGSPVELVQVQLTRFSCGSLAVGFAGHHQIADGQATANFLAAWGLATRRLPLSPLPVCDRSTRFAPRDPPLVEFPHREVEYRAPAPNKKRDIALDDEKEEIGFGVAGHDKVKVHRMHLSKDFVAQLKARASSALPPSRRGYTTFQSVVAHLWRAITAARGLAAGVTTKVRISVNGRTRMRPPVPRDYFRNVVLWAFPRSNVGELVSRPVGHAAELIYRAVAGVDNAYFRSFVDFAAEVEAEGLIPTADSEQAVLCPDLEVDAWLGINFHGLDFGGGGPFCVVPTYYPMEGSLFLVPSTLGDGSMEAYVALFHNHLEEFKRICHRIT